MQKTYCVGLFTLAFITSLLGCQSSLEKKGTSPALEIQGKRILGTTNLRRTVFTVYDPEIGKSVGQLAFDISSGQQPYSSESSIQLAMFFPNEAHYIQQIKIEAFTCLVRKIKESTWQINCKAETSEVS